METTWPPTLRSPTTLLRALEAEEDAGRVDEVVVDEKGAAAGDGKDDGDGMINAGGGCFIAFN